MKLSYCRVEYYLWLNKNHQFLSHFLYRAFCFASFMVCWMTRYFRNIQAAEILNCQIFSFNYGPFLIRRNLFRTWRSLGYLNNLETPEFVLYSDSSVLSLTSCHSRARFTMGCTDTVKQIKGKRTRNGVKCDSFGTWSDIYPLDNVLNLFLDKG